MVGSFRGLHKAILIFIYRLYSRWGEDAPQYMAVFAFGVCQIFVLRFSLNVLFLFLFCRELEGMILYLILGVIVLGLNAYIYLHRDKDWIIEHKNRNGGESLWVRFFSIIFIFISLFVGIAGALIYDLIKVSCPEISLQLY